MLGGAMTLLRQGVVIRFAFSQLLEPQGRPAGSRAAGVRAGMRKVRAGRATLHPCPNFRGWAEA